MTSSSKTQTCPDEKDNHDDDDDWNVIRSCATTEQDSPLEMAMLYESYSSSRVHPQHPSSSCGHVVPLQSLVLQQQQQQQQRHHTGCCCPVCGAVGTYIVDVGAASTRTTTTTTTSHDDDNNNNNNPTPTVVFKYGKLVYRLSVPTTTNRATNSSSSKQQQQQPPSRQPSWWSWWMWPLGGGDGGSRTSSDSTSTTHPNNNNTPRMTAQERIRSVLGIQAQGMKILCKGKILYPVTGAASATPSLESIEEQEWHVSQQLLEWSSSHRCSNSSTPSLLVMGTPARDVWLQQQQQQQQQQQLLRQQNENDKNPNHSWLGWTPLPIVIVVRDVVWHWGQWMIEWSVRWTWNAVCRCGNWLQSQVWGGGTADRRREHGD